MDSLLTLVSTYTGELTTLPLMVSVVIAITILLYLIVNRIRYLRYIPGLIFMALGLYNLYSGYKSVVTPQGLDHMWQFVIFFVSGFCGFCTALIIGVITKGRAPRPEKPKATFMNKKEKKEKKGKTPSKPMNVFDEKVKGAPPNQGTGVFDGKEIQAKSR